MYESGPLSEILFRHSYCRIWGKPCWSAGWNLSLFSQIRSCHAFYSWRANGRNGDVLSCFTLTHYRIFKVCCWCGGPIGCIVCKLLPQSDLNLIQGMSDIYRNTWTYFVLFILRAAGERFYLAVFSWQWQQFPNYFVFFSYLPNTTLVSAGFYGCCCVCFYIIAFIQ